MNRELTSKARRCKDPTNKDYVLLDKARNRKGPYSCKIDGVVYPSLRQASSALCLDEKAMKRRCLSDFQIIV